MLLGYQDKGKYFRGLLILIGKDFNIDLKEKTKIFEICEKLGFESKFVDQSVTDFFENKFIDKNPPEFSTKEIAQSFLSDAIQLSLVDNDFHTEELIWLEEVAVINGIDKFWLDKKLREALRNYRPQQTTDFEKESLKT